MTNSEAAELDRMQYRIDNSNGNSTKNEVIYSYNQTKTSQVNTSNIQFASTKTNHYSSNKTVFF